VRHSVACGALGGGCGRGARSERGWSRRFCIASCNASVERSRAVRTHCRLERDAGPLSTTPQHCPQSAEKRISNPMGCARPQAAGKSRGRVHGSATLSSAQADIDATRSRRYRMRDCTVSERWNSRRLAPLRPRAPTRERPSLVISRARSGTCCFQHAATRHSLGVSTHCGVTDVDAVLHLALLLPMVRRPSLVPRRPAVSRSP
jgi:hypothetical protein